VRKFSAAIVGLGQIGQGYDYDVPDDRVILTHASAYRYHKGFELVAAVDLNPKQRERFLRKYGLPVYSDLKELILHHRPEVFSICVPSSQHFQIFQGIIPHQPAAILCEKPIAIELSEAKEMVRLSEVHHSALLVNYMRRFEPGVLAMKEALRCREYGDIYKGIVWYSKGIFNNGSHYIDLLRFLFGEVTGVRVLEQGRKWKGHDPEPDVCICFGKIPIYFLSAREECFSAGSIELMATGGHILYKEGGETISIQEVQADPIFPGYTIPTAEPRSIPSDLKHYQWHVLDHLYRHMTIRTALNGDGESAVGTLAVIHQILQNRN